jgi:hypothetical protein
LIVQGYQGGRLAGQQVTKSIADYLSKEEFQVVGRPSFWVSIYYNKTGLLDTLTGRQLCSAEQLEDFLLGFTQSSPRFTLVDVGPNKEAAHAKIRGMYHDYSYSILFTSYVEYLHTFSLLPQTLRVFFGG